MHHMERDLGARIQVAGGTGASQTAGSEAEINFDHYDRLPGQDLAGLYHGAVAMLCGVATLAAGETLSFTGNYQHGDTTGTYTDIGDALTSTVVATGPDGGGAVGFQLKLPNLDLSQAKRFVRFQATPNFSRTGTDTAIIGGLIVVGGPQNQPAA